MNARLLMDLVREYGPAWLGWRALYEAALRADLWRGLDGDPVVDLHRVLGSRGATTADVAALAASAPGLAFLPQGDGPTDWPQPWREAAVAAADGVLAGAYPHFAGTRRESFPPPWHADPVTGRNRPVDARWTAVADLDSAQGDIKQVWERSRFTFAFTLGRAYAVSRDERYADGFWRLCDDWLERNAPGRGPHWRCAQEMSFRALAWLFAWHLTRRSPAATPERVTRLVAALRHHGRHIEARHWYAERCVKNNHAVSEAVALHSLGTALPFLPESARWRRRGRRWLVRETAWQIRDDGTYVQQSNNYARLVVQLLSWHLALEPERGAARDAIARRAGLLHGQLAAQTRHDDGRVPGLGPDDGTLLLPWSACDHHDFRPALAALGGLLAGHRREAAADGWREEAAWFGVGAAPVESRPEPELRVFPDGGLVAIGGDPAFALLRCGPNADRPPEADMLHLSLRVGGQPLLIDAGTFGYNAPGPLRHHFAGTAAHNTVSVDGRDQMRRGPRFLWHDWVQGEWSGGTVAGSRVTFDGRHEAYAPVVHRRFGVLDRDTLVVVDRLTGGAPDTIHRLHWLLADLPLDPDEDGGVITLPDGRRFALRVACDAGAERGWHRDDRDAPAGLHAPSYGQLAPAHAYAVTARGADVRFVTVCGPADALPELPTGAIDSPEDLP